MINPMYLTDINFKVVDRKLDSLEAEIDALLSMTTVDWKKVNACAARLDKILSRLQSTIDFSDLFHSDHSDLLDWKGHGGKMGLDPKVYVKAAEKVSELHTFACCCIGQTTKTFSTKEEHQRVFRETFMPTESERERWGAGEYVFFGDGRTPENQLARSLALLFMAEIVRDGK